MGRNQGVTPQNVVEVRFWVISVRAIHGQSRIMSAIAPIATECFGAGKRRYVPLTTDAPQHDQRKKKEAAN
jgi:hypothetical protein